MNLELIKPMGKMKAGEMLMARNQEQYDMLIEQGFAKAAPKETEVEKVLVLLNPEPGTYTTAYVDKPTTMEKQQIPVSDGKGDTVGANQTTVSTTGAAAIATTAKDLIAKIESAKTVEEARLLVAAEEERVTVKDALAKRISDLSK